MRLGVVDADEVVDVPALSRVVQAVERAERAGAVQRHREIVAGQGGSQREGRRRKAAVLCLADAGGADVERCRAFVQQPVVVYDSALAYDDLGDGVW